MVICKLKQQLKVINKFHLQVEKIVQVVHSIKKLGVYFVTFLSMERWVNAVTSYCHIHNIGRIKQHITSDPHKTLTHALISS